MPEQPQRQPDEGWRDIHLDDILRGVGSFIELVSGVVESLGSAANQSRTPAARPLDARQPVAPMRLGAGAAVAGVRDPLVDLFDEGEEIVLVVEWPYADAELEVGVQDDVLALAFDGALPYSADLLLPALVDPASLRQTSRNGITEIRLRRQPGGRSEL